MTQRFFVKLVNVILPGLAVDARKTLQAPESRVLRNFRHTVSTAIRECNVQAARTVEPFRLR